MHRRTFVAAVAAVACGAVLTATASSANLRAAQAPMKPGLPEPSAMRITQKDFKALLTSDHPIIVDVRTAAPFHDGHIPGAVLLAFEGRTSLPPDSDALLAQLKSSKQPVVTYCACHGESTSVRAAILLQLNGVKDVRVLTGGWDDWISDHTNPIEREP